MDDIILIGPDTPFVRILGVVLSRVAHVHIVHDDEVLRATLIHLDPTLIVFEHDDPADLFLMNPRRFGFTGPLLLLTADREPYTAIDLLEADYWLRHPIDIVLIERLVRRIGAGEPDAAALVEGA